LFDDCIDSSVTVTPATGDPVVYEETNCFLTGCLADNVSCDTQVYVTWVGKDASDYECTSDNFRISGFTDFGVVSFLESAKALANTTYPLLGQ